MQAAGGTAQSLTLLGGIGSLRGVHNAQNAARAAGAAVALHLSVSAIQQGLASFPGLAHRMEQVGRQGRVLLRQRFQGHQRRLRRPGAGLLLRHFLDRRSQAEDRRAFLAHRLLPAHPQGLSDRRGGGPVRRRARRTTPHVVAGTLERAVALAARDAAAADVAEPVVLLSPACASFDQYCNFEVRGDAFRELVLALPGLEPV